MIAKTPVGINDVFEHLRNISLCVPVFWASWHFFAKHNPTDYRVYELIVSTGLFVTGIALSAFAISDAWNKFLDSSYSIITKLLFLFVHGLLAIALIKIALDYGLFQSPVTGKTP